MMLKIEEDAHQDGLFEITSLISVCSAAATALLATVSAQPALSLEIKHRGDHGWRIKDILGGQRAGGLKRSKIAIFS